MEQRVEQTVAVSISVSIRGVGQGGPVLRGQGPGLDRGETFEPAHRESGRRHAWVARAPGARHSSGQGRRGPGRRQRTLRRRVPPTLEAEHWEAAFTTAYDAYRTSADAVVLRLGYRVPAVKGAHRISTDVANAALEDDTDPFGPVSSDRFRSGRHESEYFDPDKPVDKIEDDARWAASIASAAVAAAVG